MPDISLCQQVDCPIKDKCYRYEGHHVPTSDWQSFMTTPLKETGPNGCSRYWPLQSPKAETFIEQAERHAEALCADAARSADKKVVGP